MNCYKKVTLICYKYIACKLIRNLKSGPAQLCARNKLPAYSGHSSDQRSHSEVVTHQTKDRTASFQPIWSTYPTPVRSSLLPAIHHLIISLVFLSLFLWIIIKKVTLICCKYIASKLKRNLKSGLAQLCARNKLPAYSGHSSDQRSHSEVVTHQTKDRTASFQPIWSTYPTPVRSSLLPAIHKLIISLVFLSLSLVCELL